MKLVQSILTKNPCYTAGRKITVKGLMLHSVGCLYVYLFVFINSWNSPSYDNACVHGFIDGNDGTVYQTLPWNHRGWHCGSGSKGSGNNTHIGVEMCEPACIRYTSGSNFTCSDLSTARSVAKRTYEAAVELFAMLCKQYNLNPAADGVVISHREGHSRGIASNHGDPEHLWKGLGLGYTMDGFRKDVKAAMGGAGTTEPENGGWFRVRKSWTDAKSQKGAFKVLANAKKCADENPGYSVYDESGKAVYGGSGSGSGFFSVSGAGIHHGSEYPERTGDELREDREIYRERRLYHCGGSGRTGGFPLGQAEIRRRMDLAGLRPQDLISSLTAC